MVTSPVVPKQHVSPRSRPSPKPPKTVKIGFYAAKQLLIHLRLGFVQNNAKVNEICTVFSVTRIDLF
jgi:hypothetical protein